MSEANIYDAMPKENAACDVCGGSRFALLTRLDRYRMGIETRQCEACGLTLTNPMPTEGALQEFYETRYRVYYRRHDKPSPELLARLGIAERAAHSAAFLKQSGALSRATRILDLGCADGSLLRAIKAHAPDVQCFGVEPNPLYSQYARDTLGAQVFASLDDLPAGVKFDLILINHVLEHVRTPSAVLARLRTLLADGACLYIDVPDASRYQSLADLHIAHLYHFTAHSLAQVAARGGLRPEVIARHEPPHHPLSVRGLFVADPAAAASSVPDPEREQVRESIARLARRAPLYFARHSWLGRVSIGLPHRIWRAVVS